MAEPLDNPAAASESSEDERDQPEHEEGLRHSPMDEGEEETVIYEIPGDSGTQSQGTEEEAMEAEAEPEPTRGEPRTQTAAGARKKKPAKKTGTPSKLSAHPSLESSKVKDEAGSSTSGQSSGKKRSRRGKTKSGQEKAEQTEPKSEPYSAGQSLGDVSIESATSPKGSEASPQHLASKKARADEPGHTDPDVEYFGDQPSLKMVTEKSSVTSGRASTSGHTAGEEGHGSYASAALEQPTAQHSQQKGDGGSPTQPVTTPAVEQHELQSEKATDGDGLVIAHTSTALQHGREEPKARDPEGTSKKEGAQEAADTPQKVRRHSKGALSKILTTPSTPERSGAIKREHHGKKKPSSREGTQELPITRPSEQTFESTPAKETPQVVTEELEAAVEEPEQSPRHSAAKKVRASQPGKTSITQQESQHSGTQPSTTFERGAASGTGDSAKAKRQEQKEKKASAAERHPGVTPRKHEKVKRDGNEKQPVAKPKASIDTSQVPVGPPGTEMAITGKSGEAALASEKFGDVRSPRHAGVAGDLKQSERSRQKGKSTSLTTVHLPDVRTSQQFGVERTEPHAHGKSRGADVPTLTASDKPLDEVGTKSSARETKLETSLSQQPVIEVAIESSSDAATQEPQQAVVVPESSGGSEFATGKSSVDPQTSSGISHTGGPQGVCYWPPDRDRTANSDMLMALDGLVSNNVISWNDYVRGLVMFHNDSFSSNDYSICLNAMATRRKLIPSLVADARTFYRDMNRGPLRQQEARSETPSGYASRSGRERGGVIPSSRMQESQSYGPHEAPQFSGRGGTVAARQPSREPCGSSSTQFSSALEKSDGSIRHRGEDTALSRDTDKSRRDAGSGHSSSGSHERASSRRESLSSQEERRSSSGSHGRASSRRESSSSQEDRSQARGRSGGSRHVGSEPSISAQRSPPRAHRRETGSSAARHSRDTERPSQRREGRSPSPSRRTSADQSRQRHTAPHHDENRTGSRGHEPRHRSPSDSRHRSEVARRDARESRHDDRHHSSQDVRNAPRMERSRHGHSERRPSERRPIGPHTPTGTPPPSPPSKHGHRHRQRPTTSSRPAQESDASALTTASPGDLSEQMGAVSDSSRDEQGFGAGSSALQTPEAPGVAASFPFQSSQSYPPGGWPLPGWNFPYADYPFKVPRPPKSQRRSSAPASTAPRFPLVPSESGPQSSATESTEPGVFFLTMPVEIPEDVTSSIPCPLESYTPYERIFIDQIDYVAVYTMRMRLQAENEESRAVVESARRLLAEAAERDPDDADSDHDAEAGHGGTPKDIAADASQTQSPVEPTTHHDQEVPEGLSQTESLSQTPLASLAPSAPDSSASGMSDEFLSFPLSESTAPEVTAPQALGEVALPRAAKGVGSAGGEPSLLSAVDSSISRLTEEISGKPSKRPKTELAPDVSEASVQQAASELPMAVVPAATEAPTQTSQDQQFADREMSSLLMTGLGIPFGRPPVVMQEPSADVFPATAGSVPLSDPMVPDISVRESIEGGEPAPLSDAGTGQLASARHTSTSPSTMEQELPSASHHELSPDQDMASSQGSDMTISPPPPDEELMAPAEVPAEVALGGAGDLPAPAAPMAGLLEAPVRDLGASPTSMEDEPTAPRQELSTDEEMATSPAPSEEPEPRMQP